MSEKQVITIIDSETASFVITKKDGSQHTVLISPEDIDRAQECRWSMHKSGYVHGWFRGKSTKLHRFITNALAGFEVDHLFANKLDNRRGSLEFARKEKISKTVLYIDLEGFQVVTL